MPNWIRKLGSRAKNTPRCVRPLRYGRLAGFILYITVFLVVGFAASYFRLGGNVSRTLGVLAAGPAALWVRWMLYGRHVRAVAVRALQSELAICLHCDYSLSGLPAQHRCPECGRPYDLAETKSKWRENGLRRAGPGELSESPLRHWMIISTR